MALELNGTTGVSLVQDGVVTAADLASGAITSAALPAGSVLQVVHQQYTAYTVTASTTMVASGLTATITPKSSSSFILVSVKVNGIETNQTTSQAKWELYKNGSSISYLNDISAWTNGTPLIYDSSFSFDYKDEHGVTSALTYAAYFAISSSGPTARFNNYITGNNRTKSSITLMEIAA